MKRNSKIADALLIVCSILLISHRLGLIQGRRFLNVADLLVVQDDVQQRAVYVQPSAVVFNETQLAELVHEETGRMRTLSVAVLVLL